jgi:hypothetical protein
MAFEDLHGLAISTPSDTAAHAYRRGIELMLSAWPGGSEALELAIEADPDFALAYAARSRMHLIYAKCRRPRKKPPWRASWSSEMARRVKKAMSRYWR